MTFKELREQSGMNLTQFSKYFNIPYRTIQNWEAEVRECPKYLLDLMEYKLRNEKRLGS
jgi:DNA-binding transcriptional regulator YiaG